MRCHGREEGRSRGGEGGAEGITDELKDVATGAFNRLAEQSMVVGETVDHRFGMALPQRRGAFDVGEEKGDSAAGGASLRRRGRWGRRRWNGRDGVGGQVR